MKKRIVTIALIIALVATCFAGTYAYLTDKDEETNVFTVGDVEIQLLESTLHRDNDKATDEQIEADAADYQTYLATAGKDIVPGRWVRKAPYVKNIGSNPAYVRVTVKIPADLDEVCDFMLYSTGLNNGAFTMGNTTTETIDGKVYNVTTFTFTEALEPGEMTYYAPFWQIKVKNSLDNEDLVKVNGETLNNIYVIAEAIQSEGFADAAAAFAAFDAQE